MDIYFLEGLGTPSIKYQRSNLKCNLQYYTVWNLCLSLNPPERTVEFKCSYFNALDLIFHCLFAVSSHQFSIHFNLLERCSGGLRFCPPSVHNNLFLFHKGSFLSFQVKSVINLLFAAYTGDVSALRRYWVLHCLQVFEAFSVLFL